MSWLTLATVREMSVSDVAGVCARDADGAEELAGIVVRRGSREKRREGRLAGARRRDDADDASLGYGEVDVDERGVGGIRISERDVLDADDRFHGGLPDGRSCPGRIARSGRPGRGYRLSAARSGALRHWTTSALKTVVPSTSGTFTSAVGSAAPMSRVPATAKRVPETRVARPPAAKGVTSRPAMRRQARPIRAAHVARELRGEVEPGDGRGELDHGGGDEAEDGRLAHVGTREQDGERVGRDDELRLDAGGGERIADGQVEDEAGGEQGGEQDERADGGFAADRGGDGARLGAGIDVHGWFLVHIRV